MPAPLYSKFEEPAAFVTPLHFTDVSQLTPGLEENPETLRLDPGKPQTDSSYNASTVFPPVNPAGEYEPVVDTYPATLSLGGRY
jgi:hypothetical protein